ncbi:MAG: hypothetical protein FWH02_02630 [Oscillospiraceae bacterium]|nr:hypothetical protein [Oscillospiraceae bacterium]
MISALNMELEAVRTVLSNDVNEVGVYIDAKRDTGSYYTVVALSSSKIAKEIAGRMAITGLFSQNSDFIGSFTQRDVLHLVFNYHEESRLVNRESLYAPNFTKRKEAALSLLAALGETEMSADIGMLLLTDENVNITPDGKIYLNYFLDFGKFSPSVQQDSYYREAAGFTFGILTREYAEKYDAQVEMYPHELRLMYKKMQNKAFRSLSQIMAFVRTLPESPSEQRFGLMRLVGAADTLKGYLLKNPANLFIAAMVIVTLGYLGYQIAVRVAAGRNMRENTVYVGMQQIGEVYLGEENV